MRINSVSVSVTGPLRLKVAIVDGRPCYLTIRDDDGLEPLAVFPEQKYRDSRLVAAVAAFNAVMDQADVNDIMKAAAVS